MDRWVADAGGPGEFDKDDDIPFAETRAYVASVEEKEREYRKNYARELGIR